MKNISFRIQTTFGRGVIAFCAFILGILSLVFGIQNDGFGTLFASIFFLFLVLIIALLITLVFNKKRTWTDKILSVLSLFIAEVVMAIIMVIQQLYNRSKTKENRAQING